LTFKIDISYQLGLLSGTPKRELQIESKESNVFPFKHWK